jgi:hypothetical protein
MLWNAEQEGNASRIHAGVTIRRFAIVNNIHQCDWDLVKVESNLDPISPEYRAKL